MDWTQALERIVPTPDGEPPAHVRTGVVSAVNSDGTVNLTISGVTVPDVPVLSGAAVAAGLTVNFLAWRGGILVLGGVNGNGYSLRQAVYYTSGGTFTKANYPGLRAVRVRLVAGGGAGGGAAATGSGQSSVGGGGGGGGYAEGLVLESSLATNVTVTVGSGGSGNSGSSGGNGGTSSFGSHVVAAGGGGGTTVGANGDTKVAQGGAGGTASAGDMLSPGTSGQFGVAVNNTTTTAAIGGTGGDSRLGGGGRGAPIVAGTSGNNYGGGGGGGARRQSVAAVAGGDGAGGIVIVEVLV